MRSLTWAEARARRLQRHFLDTPAPRDRLATVVGALCGIHAQVLPSAELSLGLRVSGLTRRELAAELWQRRTLVKTYGIRGTVHLFPATDLGLWLAALSGRTSSGDERRLAALGLSREQMRELVEAIGDALEGDALTREALGAAVAKRVGAWATEKRVSAFGGDWPIWQTAIGAAANAGTLCFGPPEGARVTFVRPAWWVGAIPPVARDDALREVLRRYLAAYGPATPAEFAQWFATTPAAAREIATSLGAELETVDLEGTTALQLAGEARVSPRPSVLLLPRFDCYVVGSHPRDAVAPPAVVERARATGLLPERSSGARASLVGPMPVLLVDGAVAGLWESKRSGKRVAIRVQAFTELTRAQRDAVAAAAGRIGEIAEAEAALSFGTIATRPHL